VDDQDIFDSDRWSGLFVSKPSNPVLVERFQRIARTCPTVVLGGNTISIDAPVVHEDDAAASQLAAEHFLQRGYRHFGWYSTFHLEVDERRRETFRRTVELAGGDFICLDELPTTAGWRARCRSLQKRLPSVPKPLAVLAVDDFRAAELLEICLDAGLRVPADIAILGIGNEVTTCEEAEVPLSSIAFDYEQLAYGAAALLGRLMAGEPAPVKPLVFPPQRIITRQSTLAMAVTEPRLLTALAYIDNRLRNNIGVTDIAQAAGISRGTLHNLCIQHLRQSPAQLLMRRRIERAQQLLKGGESVAAVAAACGFQSGRSLGRCFHRELGLSPRQFCKSLHA
jgi:LacI family transcriptional regulator